MKSAQTWVGSLFCAGSVCLWSCQSEIATTDLEATALVPSGGLDPGPWSQFRGNASKSGSVRAPGPAVNLTWGLMGVGPVSAGGITLAANGDLFFKSADFEKGVSVVYRVDGKAGVVLARSQEFAASDSGVTIGKDALYTTSGNSVWVLNRVTLEVLGSYTEAVFDALGGAPLLSSTAIDSAGSYALYVADRSTGAIHALESSSGRLLWTHESQTPQGLGELGPVWTAGHGRHALALFGNVSEAGGVGIVDASGELHLTLWSGGPASFNWFGSGALSADGRRIYVTTFADHGTDVVWAIDAANGRKLWSIPSDEGRRNFFGRPAVVENRLYAGGFHGVVLAVVDTGVGFEIAWEFAPPLGEFAELTALSAAYDDEGRVFLYAVDQGFDVGQLLVLEDLGREVREVHRTSLDGTMRRSSFGSSSVSIDFEGCVYVGGGQFEESRSGAVYKFCP